MATEKPGEAAAAATTTIDALMELLKAKGKMDVNDIAGTLAIAPAIVESWAKVLESGGMVRISYEVGKMFVAPVQISAEQVKLVEEKVEVKRGLIEDRVAAQRSEIEKFANEINDLGTEVSSLERVYQQRMPAVQQMLSQINTLYDSIIEQGRSVERIKKTAEDSYQNVNRSIDEMYSKVDQLGATETNVRQGKGPNPNETGAALASILKNADDAYNALNSLVAAKDRMFDAMMQNVDAQVVALKKSIAAKRKEVDAQMRANSQSIAQIRSSLSAQTKGSREIMERLRRFKKEMEGSKKVIGNAKVQFTDKYEKVEETMRTSSALLSQDSKNILAKLDDLKTAFGDVAKIDNTLHDARKSIGAMNKEVDEARANVIDLQKTLQAMGAMSMTIEQRINVTTEIDRKVDKSKEKVSKIKKEIEETKDKFVKK